MASRSSSRGRPVEEAEGSGEAQLTMGVPLKLRWRGTFFDVEEEEPKRRLKRSASLSNPPSICTDEPFEQEKLYVERLNDMNFASAPVRRGARLTLAGANSPSTLSGSNSAGNQGRLATVNFMSLPSSNMRSRENRPWRSNLGPMLLDDSDSEGGCVSEKSQSSSPRKVFSPGAAAANEQEDEAAAADRQAGSAASRGRRSPSPRKQPGSRRNSDDAEKQQPQKARELPKNLLQQAEAEAEKTQRAERRSSQRLPGLPEREEAADDQTASVIEQRESKETLGVQSTYPSQQPPQPPPDVERQRPFQSERQSPLQAEQLQPLSLSQLQMQQQAQLQSQPQLQVQSQLPPQAQMQPQQTQPSTDLQANFQSQAQHLPQLHLQPQAQLPPQSQLQQPQSPLLPPPHFHPMDLQSSQVPQQPQLSPQSQLLAQVLLQEMQTQSQLQPSSPSQSQLQSQAQMQPSSQVPAQMQPQMLSQSQMQFQSQLQPQSQLAQPLSPTQYQVQSELQMHSQVPIQSDLPPQHQLDQHHQQQCLAPQQPAQQQQPQQQLQQQQPQVQFSLQPPRQQEVAYQHQQQPNHLDAHDFKQQHQQQPHQPQQAQQPQQPQRQPQPPLQDHMYQPQQQNDLTYQQQCQQQNDQAYQQQQVPPYHTRQRQMQQEFPYQQEMGSQNQLPPQSQRGLNMLQHYKMHPQSLQQRLQARQELPQQPGYELHDSRPDLPRHAQPPHRQPYDAGEGRQEYQQYGRQEYRQQFRQQPPHPSDFPRQLQREPPQQHPPPEPQQQLRDLQAPSGPSHRQGPPSYQQMQAYDNGGPHSHAGQFQGPHPEYGGGYGVSNGPLDADRPYSIGQGGGMPLPTGCVGGGRGQQRMPESHFAPAQPPPQQGNIPHSELVLAWLAARGAQQEQSDKPPAALEWESRRSSRSSFQTRPPTRPHLQQQPPPQQRSMANIPPQYASDSSQYFDVRCGGQPPGYQQIQQQQPPLQQLPQPSIDDYQRLPLEADDVSDLGYGIRAGDQPWRRPLGGRGGVNGYTQPQALTVGGYMSVKQEPSDVTVGGYMSMKQDHFRPRELDQIGPGPVSAGLLPNNGSKLASPPGVGNPQPLANQNPQQQGGNRRLPRDDERWPNAGSIGHPEVCAEPCSFSYSRSCLRGSECPYCHVPHAKRSMHLDKRNREALRSLPFVDLLRMVQPTLEQKALRLGLVDELMQIYRILAPAMTAGGTLFIGSASFESENALGILKAAMAKRFQSLKKALTSMSLTELVSTLGTSADIDGTTKAEAKAVLKDMRSKLVRIDLSQGPPVAERGSGSRPQRAEESSSPALGQGWG